MKQVFEANDIAVVPYTWFYDYEYSDSANDILKKIEKLGYPVVVKPATLGSSVGITYVKTAKDIEVAINDAINYDKKYLKLVINDDSFTNNDVDKAYNQYSEIDRIYFKTKRRGSTPLLY